MKIIDKFFNKEGKVEAPTAKDINDIFERSENALFTDGDKVELTYFVCLKTLAESIGKLGIHLKDGDGNKITEHPIIQLLSTRPNSFQTPADLKMSLEYYRNHVGNAYAYISTDSIEGKVNGLYPLDPSRVEIMVVSQYDKEILKNKNGELQEINYFYKYREQNGKETIIPKESILHLKGGIGGGLSGKSIAETLSGTISSREKAQKYLNTLYEYGLTANAVIKYTGDLDRAKKKRLVEELGDFSTTGSQRFIPLPFGMDLQPIDLKLTDSQFYELNKFNSLQIASAFGIKPNQLNDYSKSSYNNSEMQNLTFYVDTLLIILTKYEEEFDYKLLTQEERMKGYHFEFNINTILRGDIKSQAESLSRLTQSSIYTVNESRKYLGMPAIENGDVVMVNGSYVKLEDIGKAYDRCEKGGEKNDKSEE